MPLASLIRDHFLSAMAHGQAEMDWSSMARVLARNAGLQELWPRMNTDKHG
jgi:type IV secretory pathway VirD2 relaxase